MGNPVHSKGVTVTMDKERTLRWDMRAMRYLTEHYATVGDAVNLLAASSNAMTADGKAMDAIIHFYVALCQTDCKQKNENVNFEEMANILADLDMHNLSEQVYKAIGADSPE